MVLSPLGSPRLIDLEEGILKKILRARIENVLLQLNREVTQGQEKARREGIPVLRTFSESNNCLL